jgi:hypothetical protein
MERYGREYDRGRERDTAWDWDPRGGRMRGRGSFGSAGREGEPRGSAGEFRGPPRGGFARGRRPAGARRGSWSGSYDRGYRGYDRDLGDRLRSGWREVRESARDWFGRGRYDRGW